MIRIKLLVGLLIGLLLIATQGCYTTLGSTKGVTSTRDVDYPVDDSYAGDAYEEYEAEPEADVADAEIGLRPDRIIIEKYYYYPRYTTVYYQDYDPYIETYDAYDYEPDVFISFHFVIGDPFWYAYYPHYVGYPWLVFHYPVWDWFAFYTPFYYPVAVIYPYYPFYYDPYPGGYGHGYVIERPFKKRDWERRGQKIPVRRSRGSEVIVARKDRGSGAVERSVRRRTKVIGEDTRVKKKEVVRRGRRIPQGIRDARKKKDEVNRESRDVKERRKRKIRKARESDWHRYARITRNQKNSSIRRNSTIPSRRRHTMINRESHKVYHYRDRHQRSGKDYTKSSGDVRGTRKTNYRTKSRITTPGPSRRSVEKAPPKREAVKSSSKKSHKTSLSGNRHMNRTNRRGRR